MHKKSGAGFKNLKPFSHADIILYLIVISVVILTFLLVFFPRDSKSDGFYIYVDGNLSAEYDYNTRAFNVKEGFDGYFYLSDSDLYFYSGKNPAEYNLIKIDAENKSVKVISSTCKGHDCERTSVNENGGFIYCSPHGLKIVAKFKDDTIPSPVTG